MLRILHLLVIVCLVGAAVAVYKFKYESTYEAQRAEQLRRDIRTERERIAVLRAEWALLSAPQRIQDLAVRHLGMRPLEVAQIDDLSGLPGKQIAEEERNRIAEFIERFTERETRVDPLGEFLRSLNGAPDAAPRTDE